MFETVQILREVQWTSRYQLILVDIGIRNLELVSIGIFDIKINSGELTSKHYVVK